MGHGVDICHSYNDAHSKKKKTAKPNTGKQRGRAAQQKITVQSKLFHCINRSQIKTLTNDSPFILLSSVRVKT